MENKAFLEECPEKNFWQNALLKQGKYASLFLLQEDCSIKVKVQRSLGALHRPGITHRRAKERLTTARGQCVVNTLRE